MSNAASKGLIRLAAVLERAPAPPTESPFSSLARPRRAETPEPLPPSAPDNDYELVKPPCSIEVPQSPVSVKVGETTTDPVVTISEEEDAVTDQIQVTFHVDATSTDHVDPAPVVVVVDQPEDVQTPSSSVYPDLDSTTVPTPQVESLVTVEEEEEEEDNLTWRGEKRDFLRPPSGLPPPLWSSPPPNYSALEQRDLDQSPGLEDERFGSPRRCVSSPELNLPLPPAPGRLTFPGPLLASTPAVEGATSDEKQRHQYEEKRVTLHPSLRRHVEGLLNRVGTVPSLTEKKRVQFQIECLVADLSQVPGHALSYEGSNETLSEDGLNQTVVADVHSPPLSDQACASSPDRALTGSHQPASWMMTPKPGHPRGLTKRLENSRGEMPALTSHYLRSLSRPKFHPW